MPSSILAAAAQSTARTPRTAALPWGKDRTASGSAWWTSDSFYVSSDAADGVDGGGGFDDAVDNFSAADRDWPYWITSRHVVTQLVTVVVVVNSGKLLQSSEKWHPITPIPISRILCSVCGASLHHRLCSLFSGWWRMLRMETDGAPFRRGGLKFLYTHFSHYLIAPFRYRSMIAMASDGWLFNFPLKHRRLMMIHWENRLSLVTAILSLETDSGGPGNGTK